MFLILSEHQVATFNATGDATVEMIWELRLISTIVTE